MGVSLLDLLIPGSAGGHGFQGMQTCNFSRFVPFSKPLSPRVMWSVEVAEVIGERGREPHDSEPPGARRLCLKWAELRLMEGNDTWKWKNGGKYCATMGAAGSAREM